MEIVWKNALNASLERFLLNEVKTNLFKMRICKFIDYEKGIFFTTDTWRDCGLFYN